MVMRSGQFRMKEEILKFFLAYQSYRQTLHIALKNRNMITLKMERYTKEQRVKIVGLYFQ